MLSTWVAFNDSPHNIFVQVFIVVSPLSPHANFHFLQYIIPYLSSWNSNKWSILKLLNQFKKLPVSSSFPLACGFIPILSNPQLMNFNLHFITQIWKKHTPLLQSITFIKYHSFPPSFLTLHIHTQTIVKVKSLELNQRWRWSNEPSHAVSWAFRCFWNPHYCHKIIRTITV